VNAGRDEVTRRMLDAQLPSGGRGFDPIVLRAQGDHLSAGGEAPATVSHQRLAPVSETGRWRLAPVARRRQGQHRNRTATSGQKGARGRPGNRV